MSSAEYAAIPYSSFLANSAFGFGLGTWLQLPPSQCRMSVLDRYHPAQKPTAQASLADTAATALSSFTTAPGLGEGTMLHAVPSQCSTRVRPGTEATS